VRKSQCLLRGDSRLLSDVLLQISGEEGASGVAPAAAAAPEDGPPSQVLASVLEQAPIEWR